MLGFTQRQDPVRLMKRRLLILVLLILVVAVVRGVWGVYQKERESGGLRTEAEIQLGTLEARETALRSDLASLKSERGREEVLREEYALAKEGEKLVVIVEPPASPPPQETRTQKWLHRLFSWW